MMASKNSRVTYIRLTEDMEQIIDNLSGSIGIKKSVIMRMLLNRALIQLRTDALRAGGYDKLEMNIRPNGGK